jgi:hypothetical protein
LPVFSSIAFSSLFDAIDIPRPPGYAMPACATDAEGTGVQRKSTAGQAGAMQAKK